MICFFFFKQKTAYERRISDWSSDVCSSDLFLGDAGGIDALAVHHQLLVRDDVGRVDRILVGLAAVAAVVDVVDEALVERPGVHLALPVVDDGIAEAVGLALLVRSEEHTSELQSLMRISYAVFCLKKNIKKPDHKHRTT